MRNAEAGMRKERPPHDPSGGVPAPAAFRVPPSAFRWVAAAGLGLLGLLLNFYAVPLSPGTDLLFGGIAALLAAAALGPGPGLFAATLASARTVWLWNHPWAWLIFSAEAFTVGVLVRRWGVRILIADALYWLFLGVPLLYFTYHELLGISGSTMAVLFLKQPFNGLINALLVEALLLLSAVRRRLRVPGPMRLRSALAVVVALAATLPALLFGAWSGRQDWARNVERSEEQLQLITRSYAAKLEQYVSLHARIVRSTAEAAQPRDTLEAEHVQRLLSAAQQEFPGFLNLYAADARGTAIAFAPPTAPSGAALRGLSFRDRPYYQELRRTRSTVTSGVFRGRGGTRSAVVVIGHPILRADSFAGYVVGALDLQALPGPDAASRLAHSVRLRVADSSGVLLLDTRSRYRPGEQPRRVDDARGFAAVRRAGAEGITSYTPGSDRAPAALAAARVMASVHHLPALGWWIWAEQPYATIQAFVAEAYIRLLSLLIVGTLLAFFVSDLLAAYLVRPLRRFQLATDALAAGRLHERVGRLSSGVPIEVRALGEGFDRMAAALAGRTQELEELGEITRSLASTLDADEVLRRVTDAAVRLVRPDGCGIALLDEDGQTLHAAAYSIGMLAPAAGQPIPLEGSLVGRVVQSREPALIEDTRFARPGFPVYTDPAELGSVLCVPLTGRSGVLGTLTAVRTPAAAPFTASHLRLLERLARTAAIAVENARLLEAAQAASRAKSDFIATMSHELRTPLNAVLGHLELLQLGIHGELNEPQQRALDRIAVASRHLRGLIEEVLTFARLEAGKVEVRLADADLPALADEVAAVIHPLAREKGLHFQVRAPALAQTVRTDVDKVRQILINLAGNAVKFTEQGSVEICLHADDSGVRLAVADTGPGIAPAEQARLFRPFEQLQSGFSRAHGGTGLGLYLSSRYAALIGGRIEVQSRPGEGSTFTLVLPRDPAPPPAPD